MDVYQKLQEIKKTPGLYIGKLSLERLTAFIDGYNERQYEIDGNSTCECLNGFQDYIQNLFDIHTTNRWSEIISFISLNEEAAFYKFYELLDEFLQERDK